MRPLIDHLQETSGWRRACDLRSAQSEMRNSRSSGEGVVCEVFSTSASEIDA